MLIFEALGKRKLIDSTASEEMIKILLDQEFRDIIPAKLPSAVKVAHKTGSITGIQHDSGIVFLPDGRKYVLILLSRFEPKDEKKAIAAMADASEMIYMWMERKDNDR
jgi:beta-lactamase class A